MEDRPRCAVPEVCVTITNVLCGICGTAKSLVPTDQIIRLRDGRMTRVLWAACRKCAALSPTPEEPR